MLQAYLRNALFMICIVLAHDIPLAHAQQTPIPKDKEQALGSLDLELKEQEKTREALSQKMQEIDETLDKTKENLIDVTRSVQENEDRLASLNARIESLELKKSVLEDKLATDKVSVSRLILALERIRRTPPEAMIARPESPYKTAQSAMLMGDIIPAINRHANGLKNNLETIETVARDLKIEQDEAHELSLTLQKQQEHLENLIEQRKDLYVQTDKDLKAREISIQKISLQAQSLKDLVSRLKDEEKRETARRKKVEEEDRIANARPIPKPQKEPQESLKKGVQLPVSGAILTRYKEKDDLGAQSNGLTIEARAGSIVVAPMSGKIQFTGAFKRYGNLIIIEHENGYHSLVAGLEKIDTVVGQSVSVGEPIGKMPHKSLQTNSKLYYELRKSGNPVNPSEKFADLG